NHTNATKKPNENPAPRRETPGAARSSLPVPHSRDFASIRGSISYPRDLDILVVLYGHSLPRAAAVAATFAKWHRYQQPMPRVLCAWCYKPGNAPGELAKLPPYPWLEKILLPQYDLDDGVFRKEGLLNHLLRDHAAAPYILTLDADVWTPRRNWFRSIRDKLAENPDHVLQPFRYFKDTKENVGAYSWSAQTLPDTNPAKCHHPGLGWAFTREWVRKHGKETVFNPWHPIAMGDHAFAQEHALGPKKWIAMKYFSRVARKGLPSGRLAGVQAKVWHENHTNHAAVLQESKGSPFADRAYRWGCEGLGSWGDLAKHLVMDENGIPLLRDQKGPFAAFLRRKTEMQTEEAMHRLVSDCLHPKNNAVFCAFNAPFVGYAAVLIHSVLTNSPGWCIHAFATNVSADELGRYPFNHSLVTIHAETREFGNKEEERCYMASYRFLRYLDVLEQVAFAVYLDVDQVVLCSLDEAIAATGAADLGIIFRPHLQDRYRAIMCATVAVRPTPGAVTYWRQYQRRLADSLEWMGDQLHMIEAVEDCGDSVRCASLPESVWNSFDAGTSVRVLCTRTEDKLGFRRGAGYARHFRRLSAEVAARRDASQVALVYVVFGSDGARLDAIRKGIAETAATVDLPGVVLVLDAGTAPVVADLAATLPGAVYRHLPTGPRHVGCWQKEALWEVARKMLVGFPAIKQAVFLDADCVPLARDFFARVQQLHSAGIKAAQPWRLCRDTVEETIGGMSTCWGVAEEGKKANFWGSQPGFCWSFDLDWLARFGGLPNVEPLGGGDSLLMNLVFSAACGWSPEAEHMQALARAGKVPRQPCAAQPVDLKHHTHGPRANRGYHLRYQVAIQCLGNVLSVFERDENGLWRVQDGGIGTAWLTMMERRGEWTCDETSYIRLWSEVRAR
ncbi:MAG: hypothetical protein RBU25_13040, partial [Lentisphaeria bacterium]|nr:hypothetical protein [Lentisphaeria bacterium]